jgi:hypothetical protein
MMIGCRHCQTPNELGASRCVQCKGLLKKPDPPGPIVKFLCNVFLVIGIIGVAMMVYGAIIFIRCLTQR